MFCRKLLIVILHLYQAISAVFAVVCSLFVAVVVMGDGKMAGDGKACAIDARCCVPVVWLSESAVLMSCYRNILHLSVTKSKTCG